MKSPFGAGGHYTTAFDLYPKYINVLGIDKTCTYIMIITIIPSDNYEIK